MPVTDFRQRTAVFFIAVVLGHIILISAQVNSQRRRAAARGGHLRRVLRGAARRGRAHRRHPRRLERLRGPARRARRERASSSGSSASCRCSSSRSAPAPSGRGQLERLLGFQERLERRHDRGQRHRRRRQPRLPQLTIDTGLERRRDRPTWRSSRRPAWSAAS